MGRRAVVGATSRTASPLALTFYVTERRLRLECLWKIGSPSSRAPWIS